MNKIKLMYDLVKSMKEKEVLNGTLEVKGNKDEVLFLNLKGDMQRTASGEVAASVSTEINFDGKKINHQSSVQFDSDSTFLSKMHHHHHSHHQRMAGKCAKPRHGLRMLAFFFKLLDSLQVAENEDKTLLLSITRDGIPEELQEAIKEHLEHKAHPHHELPQLAGLLTSPETRIRLAIKINEQKDVETLVLTVEGQLPDEQGAASHELKFKGQLSLKWQPLT